MGSTTSGISAGAIETARVGARIASEGGNVVDIAVASAIAATIPEILLCSLGGSCYLMLQMPGEEAELIDGGDAVPEIPIPPDQDRFRTRNVIVPYGNGIEVIAGHGSVGVPGMLRALELAWKRHGSLPWKVIVEPAIEIAKTPIPTGRTIAEWLQMSGELLFQQEDSCRKCFLPDGSPLVEGQPLLIPNYSQTLECIADHGADALYHGDLATEFVKEMEKGGGYVTREDLAGYHAIVRKPLSIQSAGFEVALNPPPAVGGVAVGSLIEFLQSCLPGEQSQSRQAMLHAKGQAWTLELRESEFADPDWDKFSATSLMQQSTDHAARLRLQSPNTTHLSIVTADGGLVSLTMSMGYGAGVMVTETGIACNNGLGEPELNPRGFHTAARGNRLPSNMSPLIARHRDGRCLALGSPGASRITTAIAQTWIHVACDSLSYEDAVASPRLHVETSEAGLHANCEPGIDTSLLKNEFVVRQFEEPDMFFGAVKLAGIDEQGKLHAVADDRRQGGVEFVD